GSAEGAKSTNAEIAVLIDVSLGGHAFEDHEADLHEVGHPRTPVEVPHVRRLTIPVEGGDVGVHLTPDHRPLHAADLDRPVEAQVLLDGRDGERGKGVDIQVKQGPDTTGDRRGIDPLPLDELLQGLEEEVIPLEDHQDYPRRPWADEVFD